MKRAIFLALGALVALLPMAASAELIPVRPCRLFDTRNGAGTPLTGGTTSFYQVRTECRIPPNATGVTFNVTAIGGTAPGYATVFPPDELLPTVSSLNFAAGEVRGNSGFVQLSRTVSISDLGIFVATNPPGQTVHLILDLTGYTAGSLAAVAARAVADHDFSVERWDAQADGTLIDNVTGLQWEIKTDDGSIHDFDNLYSWSSTAPFHDPNGTLFTTFLNSLNTFPCFAGYCDWRMPTMDELQSLMEPEFGSCSIAPCTAIPGMTKASQYWSGTGDLIAPNFAWGGNFNDADINTYNKTDNLYARAVRGGVAPRP